MIYFFQGGPGGSSTGFGNFGELGPYDTDLKPRNTTWVKLWIILRLMSLFKLYPLFTCLNPMHHAWVMRGLI